MKDYHSDAARRSFHPIVLVSVLLVVSAQSLSAQPHEPRSWLAQAQNSDRIDSIMSEWFDRDGPGGVVLVVQNGTPIICKAYGMANLEHKVPITPQTVFNIASLDKQFTAFALALLIAERSISLDDDVHYYLPELPDFGEIITIRHLVNHTSGLPDEFSLLRMAGYWTDDVITGDQVLGLLQAQTHLLFRPGEKWQYSNSNYSLIMKIIERISGNGFSEFCQRRLFEPLNMTKTRFIDDHRTIITDRASSYEYSDSGYMYIPVNYCPSLYTTAEDLVRWIDNLENARIGGPEVVELIAQTGFLDNGEPTDYAFGQFVKEYRGYATCQHSGHIGAYTCFMVRFPELHLAVACLSNAGYFGATSVGLNIADLFLPFRGETQTEAEASDGDIRPSSNISPADTATAFNPEKASVYTGLYQFEITMKILKVQYDPPLLSIVHLSDVPLVMIPDVNGKFRMEGVNSKISFARDDQGNITGLNLHMGKQVMAAPKIVPVPLSRDHMLRFTGDYVARELMTLCHIGMTDSGLIVQHPRHPTGCLTATDSLHFVGEGKWLRQISFEKSIDGGIIGFKGSSGYARNIWFEKID